MINSDKYDEYTKDLVQFLKSKNIYGEYLSYTMIYSAKISNEFVWPFKFSFYDTKEGTKFWRNIMDEFYELVRKKRYGAPRVHVTFNDEYLKNISYTTDYTWTLENPYLWDTYYAAPTVTYTLNNLNNGYTTVAQTQIHP